MDPCRRECGGGRGGRHYGQNSCLTDCYDCLDRNRDGTLNEDTPCPEFCRTDCFNCFYCTCAIYEYQCEIFEEEEEEEDVDEECIDDPCCEECDFGYCAEECGECLDVLDEEDGEYDLETECTTDCKMRC